MATYDEAAKEAMASAKNGGLFYTPIEINHPTLPEPVRLVMAQENQQFSLEDTDPEELVTFIACAYKLRLPPHGLTPDPHAIISVDAAPGDLITAAFNLANSNQPATVIVREYIDTDRSEPRAVLNMYLTDISANMGEMRGKLRILNAANVPFPPNLIDGETFASLAA